MRSRIVLAACALVASFGAAATTTTLRVSTLGPNFVFVDFTYNYVSAVLPTFSTGPASATADQRAQLGTTYSFDIGVRNSVGAAVSVGSVFSYVLFSEFLTTIAPANAQFAYSLGNSSYSGQVLNASGNIVGSTTPTVTNANNTTSQTQAIDIRQVVDSHITANVSWTASVPSNYAIPSLDPTCMSVGCMGSAQSTNFSDVYVSLSQATTLPEPGIWALMAVGALGIGLVHGNRRRSLTVDRAASIGEIDPR